MNSTMKQLLLKPDKFHVCPELDFEIKEAKLFKGLEEHWLCKECHPILWKASRFASRNGLVGLDSYVSSRLLARLDQEVYDYTIEELAVTLRNDVMKMFQSDHVLPSIPRTTVKAGVKTVFDAMRGEYVSVSCFDIVIYPKIARSLPQWGEYEICEIPIEVQVECSRTVSGRYLISSYLADEHKPEYNNRRKLRRFSALGVTEEGGS